MPKDLYTVEPDYDHSEIPAVGVLMVNLGTPEAPTAAGLRPYLKQFLSDPRVVEVSRPLWWLILNSIVLSGSAMMIQTLGASIVADIVDEHEVETGERSEGVFFAAMGFSMKIPTGIGQLVGGILYDVIGLEPGLQPGEVAPDVLFQLGLIAGPVMSLTFLIPGLILTRYRLDRVRHAALRAILDRRASADGA